MSKRISFEIDAKGDVTVKDVIGFGSKCQEATEAVERALGKADESSRKQTDEAFRREDGEFLRLA